ncbi:CLUMA_CG008238, isoform A [Clunio marinus]|uniref:CLUMA_CG008238, isoform A n=1 Tax=Clunio marinus TaxID=568069 RepID=A0A1J1I4Q2_9DIPT|nr:CLUMA_CG008238, isoform A [Clunio marinus]
MEIENFDADKFPDDILSWGEDKRNLFIHIYKTLDGIPMLLFAAFSVQQVEKQTFYFKISGETLTSFQLHASRYEKDNVEVEFDYIANLCRITKAFRVTICRDFKRLEIFVLKKVDSWMLS